MLSKDSCADFGPRSHVVQLYRGEEELAGQVAAYLAEAILGQGVAVVLASPAHCAAITARLGDAGVDAAAAQLAGALDVLDAQAALEQFAASGVIDAAAFDAVIGHRMREAAAAGGPVRAYGEMVAGLWQAGHVNAALELETLWNRLGREHAFGLYCAYPQQLVDGEAHRDALAEIHRLHDATVSPPPPAAGPAPLPPQESATFPASPAAPRAARRLLAGTLARWQRADPRGDALLTVHELAANAVRHARSEFTVTLTDLGAALRISVGDRSPLPPGAGLPARAGHGLAAVTAMASRWGAQPLARGKAVWAELPWQG